MVDQKKTSLIKKEFVMSKLLKKVIGVDVGAKFLTVSFTDILNQDQVFNIQNNQHSILSFLKKFPTGRVLFGHRSYR